MEISAVKPDEIEAIMPLHVQGLSFELELFNQIVPHKEVDPAGMPQLKQLLARMLQTGEGMIYVSKEGATYTGYILVTKKFYPAEIPKLVGCINGIFVAENCRRAGVGKKLVEAAMDWLRRAGVHYLELYHMINDPRATAFWQKMGLKAVQLNCAMVI